MKECKLLSDIADRSVM